MAKRHWLDPLARRLLIATGQIPAPASAPAPAPDPELAEQERLNQELLALKLRQNPGLRLRSSAEVRQAAALGWRLDVNRATAADWLRLPGCQPNQVDLLVRLQAGGVQLSGPEDLQRLLQLDAATLATWLPLLEFRWYADASGRGPLPLDLNRASGDAIARQQPELAGERLKRLLRERQRGPFRDLAELQQRLQLPPALVEGLIGRVCFGEGAPGPDLPRSAGRRS